jgi:hypothetical protein
VLKGLVSRCSVISCVTQADRYIRSTIGFSLEFFFAVQCNIMCVHAHADRYIRPTLGF